MDTIYAFLIKHEPIKFIAHMQFVLVEHMANIIHGGEKPGLRSRLGTSTLRSHVIEVSKEAFWALVSCSEESYC